VVGCDLPAFCRLLLVCDTRDMDSLTLMSKTLLAASNANLRIRQVIRLLEPLKPLQGLDTVALEGFISEQYRTNLLARMKCQSPSEGDRIYTIYGRMSDTLDSINSGRNIGSSIFELTATLDDLNNFAFLWEDYDGDEISTGRLA